MVVFLAFFVTWRARAINDPRHTLFSGGIGSRTNHIRGGGGGPRNGRGAGRGSRHVFFVAGLEWRYCLLVAAVALAGLVFIFAEPYRLGRVVRFVDPHFTLLAKFDPNGHIKDRLEKSLATRDSNYQWSNPKSPSEPAELLVSG